MGANPADLLHTQLTKWNTVGGVRDMPSHRRGVDTDISLCIRQHQAALSNLGAVGELLDAAEKAQLFPVGPYRDEIPVWGKMVLAIPHGWGQAAAFDADSLRLLSTLGPQLRQIAPTLENGSVERFEEALEHVLEALAADGTIDGDVARYLLTLVMHMKQVVVEYKLDVLGDFDLARAATLLKTTIDAAFNTSTNDDAKPRWAWLREVFSVRTAVQLAIQWSTLWPTLMLPPGGH